MSPHTVRPLALGYLRFRTADPPEVAIALAGRLESFAYREGLVLADIYTDLLDPPTGQPDRAGFCALMDALRRQDTCPTVLIPSPEHLSRRPDGYTARRTIIEVEAGARVLIANV